MPNLNKFLYDLNKKMTVQPQPPFCAGEWGLNPKKMVTWLFKEDKLEIYVIFDGGFKMNYKFNTLEEYKKVKNLIDNYNF